ncbi:MULTISPECIES: type IV pilus biogenesis protein PilP [Asaia]
MNAACIQALADFQKVAEAKAKIEDVEHRKDKTGDTPAARVPPVIPGYPGISLPPELLSPTPHPAEMQPGEAKPSKTQTDEPRLPVIVMILSDEKERPTATLRMPDGNTIEVTRGSLLPDGSSVATIEGSAVYIRRGHTLARLPMDGGQAQPQTQANPNSTSASSLFGAPTPSRPPAGYPRGAYP